MFGTTLLISGALGLFNKDIIIRLGGYALDTVGEDMELVMRIPQFAVEREEPFRIVYIKEAVCFTELPWTETDMGKQRIRWTIGLTEVLWKYREMETCKKYTFLEKLTFWYYVLFEKFSPHTGLISLTLCIILGIIFGFSQTAITLMILTVFIQFLLSIAGSFQSIIDSVKSSENKFRLILRLLLLLITFVTAFQLWHSFYRLIAVPFFRRKKRITHKNNQGSSWVSPARM